MDRNEFVETGVVKDLDLEHVTDTEAAAKKFISEAREDAIEEDASIKAVELKLTGTDVRDDEDSDNGKDRAPLDIFDAKTVKVTGCGAGAGTYKRSGMCNHAPQFVHEGEWNGKHATFHLWRHWLGCWYIGVRGIRQGSIELYKYTPNDLNDMNPLGKEWVLGTDGVAPTPDFVV